MKNFFNIIDLSKQDIDLLLSNEKKIDQSHQKILKNKCIGLIFEKYSTRTRLSFNVAINNLGGSIIDLRFNELNISRDESFEDTFRAFNCYLDGLIYRTSSHEKLIQASNFFEKPIINALSDLSHPCQILSDAITLKQHFGSLELNLLWMGDMNNVCYSLVELANFFPELQLFICSPSYISSKINWKMKSNISLVNKPEQIDLDQINCVMTDVFISMNDENDIKKEKLLKPYTVTSELMAKTASNSVFMHCLPAKVGYEVSEEVIRSHKSIVWKQAYNRMVAQQKLLQFIYQ